MIVSEYCSICDKKTFRKTDDCDCQKTAHNSDHAKCEHDFEPIKTWVHTCRLCGQIEIEKLDEYEEYK
jgi:hypothetical protein